MKNSRKISQLTGLSQEVVDSVSSDQIDKQPAELIDALEVVASLLKAKASGDEEVKKLASSVMEIVQKHRSNG